MRSEIGTTKGLAKNGTISIAYEVFGPSTGKPILLIMGIGMQMLMWHDDFCRELVEHGFQVARMDNRDVGLSTHLTNLGEPSMFNFYFRPKKAAFYSLYDMADDAVAVLDALGWKSANIVGGSMGGMIAQIVAAKHPERVRSLTSMMSSVSPKIGRAKILLAMKVANLLAQPVHNEQEAGQQTFDMFKIIGSPEANYPLDEAWLRYVGAESYKRAYDPAGKLRQQGALLASPDRRKELMDLKIPTLVIHGDADPMFRIKGGRATADAIPNSRFVIIPGMGHGALPRQVWPTIVDEISKLAGI